MRAPRFRGSFVRKSRSLRIPASRPVFGDSTTMLWRPWRPISTPAAKAVMSGEHWRGVVAFIAL